MGDFSLFENVGSGHELGEGGGALGGVEGIPHTGGGFRLIGLLVHKLQASSSHTEFVHCVLLPI